MKQCAAASVPSVIAGNLRRLRAEKDVSQYQLAAAAKMSRGTIAAIECCRYDSIQTSTLEALATALGVTVGDLLPAPRPRRRAKGARG